MDDEGAEVLGTGVIAAHSIERFPRIRIAGGTVERDGYVFLPDEKESRNHNGGRKYSVKDFSAKIGCPASSRLQNFSV